MDALMIALPHAAAGFMFSLADCLCLRRVSTAFNAMVDRGKFELYWRAWIPLFFMIRSHRGHQAKSRKRVHAQTIPSWFPQALMNTENDVVVRFDGLAQRFPDSEPLSAPAFKLQSLPVGTPVEIVDKALYHFSVEHGYAVGANYAQRFVQSHGKPKLFALSLAMDQNGCYNRGCDETMYRCVVLTDEQYDRLVDEKSDPGSFAFRLYLEAVVEKTISESVAEETKILQRIAKAQEELQNIRRTSALARSVRQRFAGAEAAPDHDVQPARRESTQRRKL
jgi:hypothetical protein